MRELMWRRAVVAMWLLSLSVTTFVRCHVWQSDETLWTDAVSKTPLKPRPVMNLGRVKELAGDQISAEQAYRTVISLTFYPQRTNYVRKFSRAAAETNIAHLYMKQGHFASAWRILDQIDKEWPTFPYSHYNKGGIFAYYGDCVDAAAEYAFARNIDPTLPEPPKCSATP